MRKLLRFGEEKKRPKGKAVKLDSNIGKCTVEKKLSQRIEKNSLPAFHIFFHILNCVAGFSYILNFIQFPQESTVLINGKVASWAFSFVFFCCKTNILPKFIISH